MRIKSCSFQPARVLSVLVHASRLKLKRGGTVGLCRRNFFWAVHKFLFRLAVLCVPFDLFTRFNQVPTENGHKSRPGRPKTHRTRTDSIQCPCNFMGCVVVVGRIIYIQKRRISLSLAQVGEMGTELPSL